MKLKATHLKQQPVELLSAQSMDIRSPEMQQMQQGAPAAVHHDTR